jgi:hypothetical protein
MKKIIILLIITILSFFIGDAIWTQINKTGAKSKRLPCQQEVVVFERLYTPNKLEAIQQALESHSLQTSIKLQPSKYMDPVLFSYITKEDIERVVDAILQTYHTDKSQTTKAKLEVLVYENDKKDPGKKTAASKLYEGYVILSFFLEDRLIYKVQVDFKGPKAVDLYQRIECGIMSLMSTKGAS